MNGIIACETLYQEIEARVEDAAVRYVPHDLHEFPVNLGDERKIRAALEREIEALDREDVSSVVVLYTGTADLDGYETEHAPLVISTADDCISTFRYRADTSETGEVKAPGVYYLSRGLIDRAVDSFKLYSAYRGETDALLSRFEAAAADHPDMRVDWNEGELFERAVDRWSGMSEAAVDRFFYELLGYYETVELLDNGNLYDVHRWYGSAFRDFLEDLGRANGESVDVTFRVADGDTGLLDSLVSGEDVVRESPHVAVFEPGEPVVSPANSRSDR